MGFRRLTFVFLSNVCIGGANEKRFMWRRLGRTGVECLERVPTSPSTPQSQSRAPVGEDGEGWDRAGVLAACDVRSTTKSEPDIRARSAGAPPSRHCGPGATASAAATTSHPNPPFTAATASVCEVWARLLYEITHLR
eukprot:gene8263-biopygen13567